MRFVCLAALLAVASGFTTQPNAFTKIPSRVSDAVVDQSSAHRNRRATIVMGGKANGEFLRRFATSR